MAHACWFFEKSIGTVLVLYIAIYAKNVIIT